VPVEERLQSGLSSGESLQPGVPDMVGTFQLLQRPSGTGSALAGSGEARNRDRNKNTTAAIFL
jgi:hypothetical protein